MKELEIESVAQRELMPWIRHLNYVNARLSNVLQYKDPKTGYTNYLMIFEYVDKPGGTKVWKRKMLNTYFKKVYGYLNRFKTPKTVYKIY